MDIIPSLLSVAAGLLLLHAALHDVAARTIPDASAAALAAIGLTARALGDGLLWALLAASLVFAGGVALWLRGWLGGGDVKLLAALAMVVTPDEVPELLLAVALAGGLLALVYLALARLVRPAYALRPRALRAETWRIARRAPLPYAVAIAGGGLFTLMS